ncbi:MAG: ATP-binding protein [SAR324 cluster bacterium]|nr:ATP-binding protein [SAR324 cluster bacterium]
MEIPNNQSHAKLSNEKEERMIQLREKAIEALKEQTSDESLLIDGKNLQEAVQELHVYQIELEMQNDELRHTQFELGQVKDEFMALYDFAPVGYITLDELGRIKRANLKAASIIGLDRGKLVGAAFQNFIQTDLHGILFNLIKNCLDEDEAQSGELLLKDEKQGESVAIRIDMSPFVSPEGNKLVRATIQDQTLQKQQMKALELSQKEAELANRTKSEFIANISQEIRTPLNSILGFSELMMGDTETRNNPEFSKIIHSSGESLLVLINDILDMSKIEAGMLKLQKEAVNLPLLFEDISNVFTLQAKQKGIVLSLEIDEKIPEFLHLDLARLRQIVFNLVGNAIKFTAEGCVAIKVSAKENTELHSSLFDLVITVQDTGIGIPIAEQEDIFKAFVQKANQNTSEFGGTGLGLAISQRLAQIMDGSIQLQSSVNEGSCFTVTLPQVQKVASEQKAVQSKNSTDIQFEKASVLIVEDNPVNLMWMTRALEKAGLEVHSARDGIEGVKVAQEVQPDLILMDLAMPRMDGFGCMSQLQQDRKTKYIPVIAVSAKVLKEDKLSIKAAGFNGYLAKPVSLNQIYETLATYLTPKEDRPSKK